MIACDRCKDELNPQPTWQDMLEGEFDFRLRFENWQELERYIVCTKCHLYLQFVQNGDDGYSESIT